MKAGMSTRSAKLSQRSFAISEVSTRLLRLGVRDQPAQRVRRVDDVGIGQQQVFRRERRLAPPSMPCFTAHSLPVQPAGSGAAAHDGEAIRLAERGRRAARDIGGAVVAVVVDQHDREAPG